MIGYFDPEAPIGFLSGTLPHWRQEGTTYFVTFRLADSLPQEKLKQWREEREKWLAEHPEPHDEATRRDYYIRFPQRLQQWLDAGSGSCILTIPEVKHLVENALKHFKGQRYELHEFVVAPNHVHILVSPLGEHDLSQILHSWKSFTAHEILKVETASRRLSDNTDKVEAASRRLSDNTDKVEAASRRLPNSQKQSRDGSATIKVWQKESFDHIVRSPASMEKFRAYIRAHGQSETGSISLTEQQRRDAAATLLETGALSPTEQQRRDAAVTLAAQATAPLAGNPELRNLLIKIQKTAEQVIDVISCDRVLFAGAAPETGQNAEKLVTSFRDYLEQHRAEITALQILYSRPYRHRLTESMLKELEKKLRENHAAWTEDCLWDAFAVTAPEKVKGRSQAGRFADLVALVRFALSQQPVLEPFAESVRKRFRLWLEEKTAQGITFTPEQRTWLELIRGHIATSLSIDADDFDYAPFSQQGGLGKAYQLFGGRLPELLDELNEALAA